MVARMLCAPVMDSATALMRDAIALMSNDGTRWDKCGHIFPDAMPITSAAVRVMPGAMTMTRDVTVVMPDAVAMIR